MNGFTLKGVCWSRGCDPWESQRCTLSPENVSNLTVVVHDLCLQTALSLKQGTGSPLSLERGSLEVVGVSAIDCGCACDASGGEMLTT
jgi:hypothetical protein